MFLESVPRPCVPATCWIDFPAAGLLCESWWSMMKPRQPPMSPNWQISLRSKERKNPSNTYLRTWGWNHNSQMFFVYCRLVTRPLELKQPLVLQVLDFKTFAQILRRKFAERDPLAVMLQTLLASKRSAFAALSLPVDQGFASLIALDLVGFPCVTYGRLLKKLSFQSKSTSCLTYLRIRCNMRISSKFMRIQWHVTHRRGAIGQHRGSVMLRS